MTIIVSIKINDGVVMASDSMSTFSGLSLSYQNANKISNLVKGLPIGAMLTGSGGIGNESAETLLKDFRGRLSGSDLAHADWAINPGNYTMQSIAERLHEFFSLKASASGYPCNMLFRICGYSSNAPLSEIWEVAINRAQNPSPQLIQSQSSFGIRWNGEHEPLNRLILGVSEKVLNAAAHSNPLISDLINQLYLGSNADLAHPAMPIKDAIDLGKFLVETTVGFIKFSSSSVKTVGGPIEIAVITKHEGFKWVARKHFYDRSLQS